MRNVDRESTDGGSRLTSPRTPRLTPATQTHGRNSRKQSQQPSFRFIQYVFSVSGAKTS